MHIMVDLETLSVRPDAAIIQIGALMFEARSGGKIFTGSKAFNRHIILQDGLGSIDHGTLTFWLREVSSAHMGMNLQENAVPMHTALSEFAVWPSTIDDGLSDDWSWCSGIWAKPSNFDLPILANAFAKFGTLPPWPHHKTRCLRTVLAMCPREAVDIDWSHFVHHDALDDATGQVMQLQKALEYLKIEF